MLDITYFEARLMVSDHFEAKLSSLQAAVCRLNKLEICLTKDA